MSVFVPDLIDTGWGEEEDGEIEAFWQKLKWRTSFHLILSHRSRNTVVNCWLDTDRFFYFIGVIKAFRSHHPFLFSIFLFRTFPSWLKVNWWCFLAFLACLYNIFFRPFVWTICSQWSWWEFCLTLPLISPHYTSIRFSQQFWNGGNRRRWLSSSKCITLFPALSYHGVFTTLLPLKDKNQELLLKSSDNL